LNQFSKNKKTPAKQANAPTNGSTGRQKPAAGVPYPRWAEKKAS